MKLGPIPYRKAELVHRFKEELDKLFKGTDMVDIETGSIAITFHFDEGKLSSKIRQKEIER